MRFYFILFLFYGLSAGAQTVIRQVSNCAGAVPVLPPPDTTVIAQQDSLVGWFRADAGLVMVNGGVDVWQNQAAQNLPDRMSDLVALSASNRPTVGTTSMGRPALIFNGSSVVQALSGTKTGWTVIIVNELTALGGEPMLLSRATDAAFYWAYNNSHTLMDVSTRPVTVTAGFSMHALSSITGSGLGSYVQNGNVLKESFNVPAVSISPFRIGAWYNLTNFFKGAIAEIFVFEKAMTPAQIVDFYNRYVKLKHEL